MSTTKQLELTMYNLHVVTLDDLPSKQHYQAVNKVIEVKAVYLSKRYIVYHQITIKKQTDGEREREH